MRAQDPAGLGWQGLESIVAAGGTHGDRTPRSIRSGKAVADPRPDRLRAGRVLEGEEGDLRRDAVNANGGEVRRPVVLPVTAPSVVDIARGVAGVIGDRMDAGLDHCGADRVAGGGDRRAAIDPDRGEGISVHL